MQTQIPAQISATAYPSMVAYSDAKHWRQLAETARARAALLADPEAKRTMLWMAEGYETFAADAIATARDEELSLDS